MTLSVCVDNTSVDVLECVDCASRSFSLVECGFSLVVDDIVCGLWDIRRAVSKIQTGMRWNTAQVEVIKY